MRLLTTLLSTLLLIVAVATAALKLVREPEVIETLANVEVTGALVTVLAVIELIGAAGLVIARPRLALAAAAGLTLFFLGAVGAHLRVGDTNVAAPLVLAGLAAAVAWLHRNRIEAQPDRTPIATQA